MTLSPRKLTGVGFLICAVSILIALYFQFVKGLSPCPLCIMQRVAIIGAGLLYGVAFCHNPKTIGLRLYAGLLLVCTLFGVGVALRQIYLQHLPPGLAPACGPGLNYLIQTLPLSKLIVTLLKGTGDCAVVHWRFLGLSIASWSGVAFVFLTLNNLGLLQIDTLISK